MAMNTTVTEPSLWEVEDSPIPKVKDLAIAPVTTKDVSEFCRRYHYSGTKGSALWRWGLWDGPTLYGVIAYNMTTRDAAAAVFGDEHAEKVWHIGRLAMAETAPHNSESRLIGGSLREIERLYPDVWAVITFAAIERGHIGYVYQATNALYIGTSGAAHGYKDQNGNYRSTKTWDGRISLSEAKKRGWTVYRDPGKHRYLYILGNKRQRRERRKLLKYEPQPYPKHDHTRKEGHGTTR